MTERKQAMQKPPPGIVFVNDYKDDDGNVVIPGIATRLGLTPGTFRKWLMAKKGPATFMLGKRRAARIQVIDDWMAEQERIALEPDPKAEQEMSPPEPKRSNPHRKPAASTTTLPAAS